MGLEKVREESMERGVRRVLLAVPESETARVLAEAFAFHGVETVTVASGAEALAAVTGGDGRGGAEGAATGPPDLVVLDLGQPDVDGLVLVGDLRARTKVPILVGGESEGRSEALLAFRLGADDFVAKPFDVDDVVARVEAALRRIGERSSAGDEAGRATTGRAAGPMMRKRREAEGGAWVVGDLALDVAHHRVMVGGEEVRLSRSEYLLLSALMSHPDELLSRLELARAVWGEQLAQIGRPIDQHMYRLRSKLQAAARKAGVQVPTIASVPGFGYRLLSEPEEARAAA